MSQIFVVNSALNPREPLTISGNTGTATFANNNMIIETENTTVQFFGDGNSLTQDFGLTNLVLGSSLPSLTSGSNNVGLGSGVFGTLTSGSSNVGGGTLSFQSITTGSSNVVWGFGAGRFITIGSGNMLFGTSAGSSITSGNNNTAIGSSSLGSYTTGPASAGGNLAIGAGSLSNLSTGISNISFGSSSGSAYISSESSNILFSNSGTVSESNTIRIGTQGTGTGQQNRAFIAGITSASVAASAPVGVNSSGQLSTLGYGSSGQVLKSTGASSSPTWQSEGSYALNMITATTASPLDSTTYYMIGAVAWNSSFTSPSRIFIPKSGTIVACYGAINVAGTLASNENVTINIRLNNTTDTAITTTSQFTAALNPFSNNALSISVVAGDFISFSIVTPAWGTNPTNCTLSATVFIT